MSSQHTNKALSVFAFFQHAELINFLKTHGHDSEMKRSNDIMNSWQQAQPYVKTLAENERHIASSIQSNPISSRYKKQLETYASNSLFQKTFPAQKCEFAMVEIDKLVAAQKAVNVDFCTSLIEEMKNNLSMKELIRLCLSPEREQQEVQYLESAGNGHIFTSPNSDIRYLGSYYKALTDDDLQYAGGGLPVAAIISFVGYGIAPVNIFRTTDRMILNNGFHRVYALRALGIKEVPAVIQNIQQPAIEFPTILNGLPREYLLGSPRPALLKDFFDEKLTATFRIKKKLKTIKLQISSTGFDVPY